MLKKAGIGSQTITRNTTVKMESWIDARFENKSTKPVFIYNRYYEPNEIFYGGVADLEVTSDIEIRFDPTETKKLVYITYGTKKNC